MVIHEPRAGAAPIGLGVYGDETEHVGEPDVIVITPPFRPFFDTDARSVLLTLMPHHYNLIPNPAFRTNTTGWVTTGITVGDLDADAWTGQSMPVDGTGDLRYRAGTNRFVYVGPMGMTLENQWDFRRGGGEYTFSAYFKGGGEVRLEMSGHFSEDVADLNSQIAYVGIPSTATPATYSTNVSTTPNILESTTGRVWRRIEPTPTVAPFYEDSSQFTYTGRVTGSWVTIPDDGQWHRVSVRTEDRVEEGAGKTEFLGSRWVDTRVEFRSASSLKVSALMLNPTEDPCDYFDGGMSEDTNLDDFLWESAANASPSYYYYDRVIRAKWLWRWLPYVIPITRPFQIFFGSYWRPYDGVKGETKLLTVPASFEQFDLHREATMTTVDFSRNIDLATEIMRRGIAQMDADLLEAPEDDTD